MNRKTFKIVFFIKRSKLLKNKEAPIFVRITIDRERAEASIRRSINPAQWNTQNGTANSDDDYSDELNQYLN